MEDAQFSDDFLRFLQTTLPSVDAAELLLLAERAVKYFPKSDFAKVHRLIALAVATAGSKPA